MTLKQSNRSWVAAVACSLLILSGVRARSAESITLLLRNGDRITGTITSEDTNRVVLATPWVKELTVPLALISKREPVPGVKAQVPAVGAGATAGTVTPPLKNNRSQSWAGEIAVGTDLGFSQKNHQLYSGRAKIIYAYGPLKNTFDYDFSYGNTAGILSANRMDGFSKTDVNVGRRLYVYNLFGAGYDEIRKIDLRYEIGPGVGYHLVQAPSFLLNTEFGVDYQGQQLADHTSTDLFFFRVAENFSWRFNSKAILDEKFEFFPRVDELDLYRFRFETNFKYQLLSNLALNLTVLDQYDSQPAEAVTRNDLQVRSSVGVKF
jgi:hypothetical protein